MRLSPEVVSALSQVSVHVDLIFPPFLPGPPQASVLPRAHLVAQHLCPRGASFLPFAAASVFTQGGQAPLSHLTPNLPSLCSSPLTCLLWCLQAKHLGLHLFPSQKMWTFMKRPQKESCAFQRRPILEGKFSDATE